MAALTNYGEEKLSKHLLGVTSFTMPAELYISLHTADPTETGATGEITAGGYTYARQPATFQWDAGNSWTETSALIRWDNLPYSHIYYLASRAPGRYFYRFEGIGTVDVAEESFFDVALTNVLNML